MTKRTGRNGTGPEDERRAVATRTLRADTKRNLEDTAYHEAGHAVAGMACGYRVSAIVIRQRGQPLGETCYDGVSVIAAHRGSPLGPLQTCPPGLPDDVDPQTFSDLVAEAAAAEHETRSGRADRNGSRVLVGVSHSGAGLACWMQADGATEEPPMRRGEAASERWWAWLRARQAWARAWITERARWARVERLVGALFSAEVSDPADGEAWRRSGHRYSLWGAALDAAADEEPPVEAWGTAAPPPSEGEEAS